MRWQGSSADINCHRAEVPCISVGKPMSRGHLDFGFGLHLLRRSRYVLIFNLFLLSSVCNEHQTASDGI